METIYLDNNATTRVAGDVATAMERYWRDEYGNPSSLHRMGQAARNAVEQARERTAALIGAEPREIVFTSGGTEADNLAILGALAANPTKRHIVTTGVEHVAVHSLCRRLAKEGYRVTFVRVNDEGCLDLDEFERSSDDETALASVMYANNETGVVFPIREIAEIAARRGVPLHVDAVQAAGKLEIDVKSLGIGAMSLSAHKMHGPKGAGALYLGRGFRVRSQLTGGHQERDVRPGTENVAAIVGFGAAAELAGKTMNQAAPRIAALRDRLEHGVVRRVPSARVIGGRSERICNTTKIGFEGLEAEAILIGLSERGVFASSGSACSSGSLEPSHVLAAMGIPERIARGAVRFSLSRETTETEVDRAVEIAAEVVSRLQALCAVN